MAFKSDKHKIQFYKLFLINDRSQLPQLELLSPICNSPSQKQTTVNVGLTSGKDKVRM